jgi:hypothetical protein
VIGHIARQGLASHAFQEGLLARTSHEERERWTLPAGSERPPQGGPRVTSDRANLDRSFGSSAFQRVAGAMPDDMIALESVALAHGAHHAMQRFCGALKWGACRVMIDQWLESSKIKPREDGPPVSSCTMDEEHGRLVRTIVIREITPCPMRFDEPIGIGKAKGGRLRAESGVGQIDDATTRLGTADGRWGQWWLKPLDRLGRALAPVFFGDLFRLEIFLRRNDRSTPPATTSAGFGYRDIAAKNDERVLDSLGAGSQGDGPGRDRLGATLSRGYDLGETRLACWLTDILTQVAIEALKGCRTEFGSDGRNEIKPTSFRHHLIRDWPRLLVSKIIQNHVDLPFTRSLGDTSSENRRRSRRFKFSVLKRTRG